jgi:rubrerythrin
LPDLVPSIILTHAREGAQGATMQDHADFFSAVTALGAIQELDVDAMRLLYRIECSGEDFYNLIAERIGNAEATELLRRNAREERGHAERVRKALAIKLGRDVYEPTAEDVARYPIPLPDTIPVELLPVIVQGEIDGDRGYQQWADRESDPEIQRLLRLNGREETVHGERVKQVMSILGAAKPS